MSKELYQEIQRRSIPQVLQMQNGQQVTDVNGWSKRRAEIIRLYQDQMYGDTGLDKGEVSWKVIHQYDKFLADKAVYQQIQVKYQSSVGEYEFPFHLTLPKSEKKVPVFLLISFEGAVAGASLPLEEIIEQGYGVASVNYQDLALDVPEYKGQKLSALIPEERRSTCGTIALWSFGASRMLDCLLEMPQIDPERVAVVGHSRLGKTALWCGALDERFSTVISNDSGAGGAAFFRGTVKETLKDLCRPQINFWFRESFLEYADREEDIPLDQHFLLGLIAPRHVYISSAVDDEWADCRSEFLAAVEASKVYELLGKKGIVKDDTEELSSYPEQGDVYHQGRIGHHLRAGNHFFSRYDWNQMIVYRNRHRC